MATKVARYTQDNQNPVGMIVASMLTETQFQSINGTNWVLAAGQSVAGSLYATTTGSSLAPDLRGRVMAGKDNMGGTSANVLGATNFPNRNTIGGTGGAETHQLLEAQMPGHNHGGGVHGHGKLKGDNAGDAPAGNRFILIASASNGLDTADNLSRDTDVIQNSAAIINTQGNGGTIGNGQSHNNTQPTIIVNYFIKIN